MKDRKIKYVKCDNLGKDGETEWIEFKIEVLEEEEGLENKVRESIEKIKLFDK